jgi:CheY-like chemotaxis protein
VEQTVSAPPEAFTEQVRSVLLHLYDPAFLQTHALLRYADDAPDGRGRGLRRALLEAIAGLHPGPRLSTTSRAWRTYRLLELRYIEGLDVASTIEQLAIGKTHYHREHQRALQAVAATLWERWGMAARGHEWAPDTTVASALTDETRREAAQLVPQGAATSVDLAGVLDGVSRLVQPLCRQRGVSLEVWLPARLPAVSGERVALRQALLAALSHAIDAAEGGTARITVRPGDRWVEVDVSSDGHGRETDEARRLAVEDSRPFVEALKGELHCLVGSDAATWTVRLTLPVSAGPHLLVVDNNADFVRLVTRYLEGHGWDVTGATDVDRALAHVQELEPSAILLDVVLPGRDGWELLEELKSHRSTREIPVIVCSVLSEPSVALALGAAGYLHKPIDEERLVAALRPYAQPGRARPGH